MNIHEYQAKAVLREFGAPLSKGIPAFTPEEAVAEQPPAFALVGDSEVIMAGYLPDAANCGKLVEEVLAVRAGGRPSLLTGPLGKTLRDVPVNARGLIRGDLPREWVALIARSSIGVSPHQLAVDLLPPAASSTRRARCSPPRTTTSSPICPAWRCARSSARIARARSATATACV